MRKHFAVLPRIEALAVVHGELACTNEDLIRNAAYNWSPMSADEISDKTGIEERRYTARSLEEIALQAAKGRWHTPDEARRRSGLCSCARAPAPA